jgi:uncharacterized protein YndB with AHSA1/START domain
MAGAGDRLRVTQFVRGTREEVYRAFSDPRLARKWAPDGCRAVHQWKEEDPVETRVRVEFKDRKGGTEVVLTQKGFREASEARGHKKGWSSALKSFAKVYAAADGRGRRR